MTSRGEDLAQRIEQSIREAIERMVGEMRSSIDDVRTAVVQQLEAASQSVQADSKSFSVRSQLEQILAEINEVVDPKPVASAAAAAPADSTRLRRAIRAVEHGKSQVEILNALLDQLLEFGSRAALLIQKGDAFAGWKGAGFDRHGGQDENVKRFTASVDEIPDLSRLVREEKVIATSGRSIADRLGASAPASALIIPMVIKDKVAAAIYVDVMEEGGAALDRSSIEILVFTTGLLIDTLAIRKKTPSPSLSADDDADATMVIPPVVAAPPPTRPAPREEPRMPVPPPRPAPVTPRADETMIVPPAPPPRSFELDTPAPPPMTFQPSGPPPMSFEPPPMTFEAPKPPPPAPPPPPPAAPKAAAAGEADRPSTQYIPPPGVVGGRFASQQAQSPEAKKHEEAKRFARLLVSEIKLYNEAKIEAGRKERDLYQRMKEDIDRSRQMYEERIPDEVRSQSNYFYDELVRILADGKPDLLGL